MQKRAPLSGVVSHSLLILEVLGLLVWPARLANYKHMTEPLAMWCKDYVTKAYFWREALQRTDEAAWNSLQEEEKTFTFT